MELSVNLTKTTFDLGESVTGQVEWTCGDKPMKALVVDLLWFTEGKGSEDVDVVRQVEFQHPAASGRHDFEFDSVEWPWSFSGRLVSLIWAVEARLDPHGPVDRQRITIAPDAREVSLGTD